MQSPNLVKVVGAFVAGVVIALGSALIYIQVNEMDHPEPVVIEQPPAEPPQPSPPPTAAIEESSPAPTANPPSSPPAKVVKKLFTNSVARRQPKIPLAQLARHQSPANEPVTYAALHVETPPDVIAAPEIPTPQPSDVPPVPQPHMVTLQPGTALSIRLSETLSTDHYYTGDTFRASLEAPVISDGFIIADRGSKVLGRVVLCERPASISGTSELNLTLTEINTTDGQRIRVQTDSFEQRGPASVSQDAATIAGGALLGAIVGAAAGGGKGAAVGAGVGGAVGTTAVLASHARAAVLPAETTLMFRLATPLTITEKLN